MTELIPYFAGLINILCYIGFRLAVVYSDKHKSNDKTKSE